MRRWQALAALAGLFALGVLSGALGAHLYYARALERPPGPPPFMAQMMGRHLEQALDLTPAQRDRMRRILAETRREAEALRFELAPRLHEVMERGHRRIGEMLTPEQRARFEELREHHRRRAERFLGGRGGRRHPRHPGQPHDG